jgi:hypothetical protein
VLYALPHHKDHGIAATFFTNTREVIESNERSVIYVKQLIQNGMEVASHFSRHHSLTGDNHPGHVMSEPELRLLLEQAISDISAWGGARNGLVESNTTPWQEWNDLAQRVIPEYHTSSSHRSAGPMSYPPADYMDCTSYVIERTTTVEQVEAIVQDCMENRKFVQLMFHVIEHNDARKTQANGQYAWLDTQLEELCAWCEQKRRQEPSRIIFPQMRDAVRYMKGQGDYDYRVAKISVEIALSSGFPFLSVRIHSCTVNGEEILLSSIL